MNADPRPLTVTDLLTMKAAGKRVVMLTCYDAIFARLLEDSGVDVLLVGDSLNQVIAGHETTLSATLDQMIYHAAAVRRGSRRALVFVDLPFLTYQISIPEAIRNAGRVLQETGAHGVKLEGGGHMVDTVAALVERGIPVMGHLGLTPQSVHALGGYRVQGRDEEAAERLVRDAKLLQSAGACAVVLELIPAAVAGPRISVADHSDHWNRSRTPLRRSGSGAARHARAQRAVCPQVSQALRQVGTIRAGFSAGLCRRCAAMFVLTVSFGLWFVFAKAFN